MYTKIIQGAQAVQAEVIGLSRAIHAKPELGFTEHFAMNSCADLLEKYGFSVERGAGKMETSFKARYHGAKPGKTVAFLAEYDSLPGLGHACGHNLIAAGSVGAGLILSQIADELGGDIVVLGTPAEEGGGGKITLLANGAFDDIDYSIMMHPSTENLVGRGGRATVHFSISFHGKSCHSSAPEAGINALNAIIQLFNMIDNTRALLPEYSNLNGVITNGGTACNVIPDLASAEFSIRANTQQDGDVIMKYLRKIIAAVEQLTGATAEYKLERGYAERHPNLTIESEIKSALEEMGETVETGSLVGRFGSSDIGNVTLKMPGVHTYYKVAERGVNSHSLGFTAASNTDYAYDQMIKSAKAMAQAGYRILTDDSFRAAVDTEFQENVASKQ